MRDAVSNKERCKRRRTPTQDPSTYRRRRRPRAPQVVVLDAARVLVAAAGEEAQALAILSLEHLLDIFEALGVVALVGVPPVRPAKRGITRDYTPFLLTLQGMTLQLQGITRLSF